jgi:NhaP-type Na+/H+ or K+/H+ antiporter
VIHAYGFLAVFAAGLSLRRAELAAEAAGAGEEVIDPVLGFNERIERIAEVALVVVVGGILSGTPVPLGAWWFVPLLFVVIRPVAAAAGLAGTRMTGPQKRRVMWFGIRGIGSVYYLTFALAHGFGGAEGARVAALVVVAVAASVVAHGVSVTPLMAAYARAPRAAVSPPG